MGHIQYISYQPELNYKSTEGRTKSKNLYLWVNTCQFAEIGCLYHLNEVLWVEATKEKRRNFYV